MRRASLLTVLCGLVGLIASTFGAAIPVAAEASGPVPHVWKGTAGGIAGGAVYNRGEWIYTDYAFDDHGAAAHAFVPDYEDSIYPGDTSGRNFHGTFVYPSAAQTPEGGYDVVDSGYRYNAADLVELRTAIDAVNIYFQVRFNYLPKPDGTVIGIGIDTDRDPATGGGAWPLGAGLSQQNGYEYFVTLFGTGGYLTSFSQSGIASSTNLSSVAGATTSEDMGRYTFDAAIPRTVMDAGRSTWRLYAGTGLWDATARSWMQVPPGPATSTTAGGGGSGLPNIFNLAFRHAEPVYPTSQNGTDFNYWDELQQAADLAGSDISRDYADVDFGALQDQLTPGPGDLRGTYERTYTSGFNFGKGLIREARRPDDDYDYLSPTQPYEVYVPPTYDPAHPAPLWILEHYRGGNYRGFTLSAPGLRTVADALGAIVVMPNARGQYRQCESDAEADSFEVLADAARHYNINRDRVYLGGMSMGGFCTWRLGLLYPDLFAAAIVYSGWPYSAWPAYGAAGVGPAPGTRYDMTGNAASGVDLPIQVIHGSNDEILPFADTMGMIAGLEGAGAELNVNVYLGHRHESTFPGTASEAGIKWLKGRTRQASPPVVRYVINPLTSNPDPANGAPADFMSKAGWCNHPPFSGTLSRTLQPGLAMVYDRAYWISGLTVADCSRTASVAATSHALSPRSMRGVTRDFSLQSDSLGSYLNEGQTLAPAPQPAAPVVDLNLTGLTSVIVALDQAGLTPAIGATVTANVDTDVGAAVGFTLPSGTAAREARLDGVLQAVQVSHQPTVSVPTGHHVVTLSLTGAGFLDASSLPITTRAGWSRRVVAVIVIALAGLLLGRFMGGRRSRRRSARSS